MTTEQDRPPEQLVKGPDGRWQRQQAVAPRAPEQRLPGQGVPAQEAPAQPPESPPSGTTSPPRSAPVPAGRPTRMVRDDAGRWVAVDADRARPVSGADEAPARGDGGARPGPASRAPAPRTSPPPDDPGPIVRRLALRLPGAPHDRQVVITGDSGQPVAQLAAELRRVMADHGVDPAVPVTVDGRPLPAEGTVVDIGLHDGAVVAPGRAAPDGVALPRHGYVLRVVGGPDAGRIIEVGTRRLSIGRSSANDVRLRDPNVSRTHAVLQARGDGVVLHDLGSANGTRVEGEPQTQVLLQPGQVMRMGDTLLELGEVGDTEHVTLEHEHAALGLHRRFRSGSQPPDTTVRHPRKDTPSEPAPLNLLLAFLPAIGIGAIVLLLPSFPPTFLAFAAISPILTIGRQLSQKRTYRQKLVQAEIDHAAALKRFGRRLKEVQAEERAHLRAAAPDAARVVEAALYPTKELWSRRATDPDALTLRVGAAYRPSAVRIDGRRDEDGDPPATPDDQPWVPVTVPLDDVGGLGLVGDLDRLRPLAISLVLQAVVLHAPSELQVVLLAGPEAEPAWRWLRWLPHVRAGRSEPSLLLGTDPSSRSAQVERLRRILTQRQEAAEQHKAIATPRILVIHDDASARLREGVAEILREGGPLGIHALALDTQQPPEGCDAAVFLGAREDAARVDRKGEPSVSGVITDAVRTERAEVVARRLAPLQVVGEDDDDGLPTSCRLLGTIGVEPTADHVRARWRATSPSARAVIGVGPERPVALDLTRDGPHALVAGTTGAGKSEFIKTFVASLALANHPDDLSFLFIDFKGGGDYQVLKRLPHAVALTTSLDDPAAFERALELLEAEMARRIEMLQAVGTSSIEGYMAATDPGKAPMPRLVVVVDEFAELKDKAPQQLDKLVSVARTGRSVGVHLVLATQRPSGVVTSQIDANVGLRVCFRVKDELESEEIIDSPLAGRIAERHRGRCFFRSAATPLTEAQTARVAGARPGSTAAAPIRATEVGWDTLGRPLPRGPRAGEVPDTETDLWDVVEATGTAATDAGWTGSAIPWPPELPDHLPLSSLAPPADPDTVPIGLVDVPTAQSQEVLGVAFGRGHVVVAGSGGTGRSTALRTLLVGAVRRHPPSDLVIAALDFGGGALLPLQQLPHCAAMSLEDIGEAEEVVATLEKELARRRDAFARHGWPDLRAQRSQSDQPMPWLLLAIDGWDNLAEEGARQGLPGRIAQLLARGTPQGLQVVMAGDRGTTHSQIARHLAHRYGLRFNRTVDAELQGVLARELPAHQPPGRAIEVATRRLVQMAVLDDPDGLGQAVAFQKALEAAAAAHRDGAGASEDQARPLLSAPSLAGGIDLADVPADAPPGLGLPVLLGMGDDPRQPVWADVADEGLAFVVGPGGSGRTTALRTMAAALRRIDDAVDVAVVAPSGSPLHEDPPPAATVVSRAELAGASAPPAALQPAEGRRLLVLVDDLDGLDDGADLQAALGRPLPDRAVLVAADVGWISLRFSGLAAAVRRPRTGIVLSPQSTSNGVQMFGTGLPQDLIRPARPGRAVTIHDGRAVLLQVPRP